MTTYDLKVCHLYGNFPIILIQYDSRFLNSSMAEINCKINGLQG